MSVDKSTLLELLKNYNSNKSKLLQTNRKIEQLKTLLIYANQDFNQTQNEAIEEIALSAPALSDMPKGGTNKFHSVTENAMLYYECAMESANNQDLQEIKSNVAYLERCVMALESDIYIIEDMLESLGHKQKFIIVKHYFDEYTMPEILVFYEKAFVNPLGIEQLRNIKDQAIDKMLGTRQ